MTIVWCVCVFGRYNQWATGMRLSCWGSVLFGIGYHRGDRGLDIHFLYKPISRESEKKMRAKLWEREWLD